MTIAMSLIVLFAVGLAIMWLVRRSLAGMRMALNLPVSSFSGVAIRVTTGDGAALIAVVLEHKDPGLVLPLFASSEADEAFTEWRSWGNVLGLPLLVEDEGALREPLQRMGGVRIEASRPRRRRRNAIKRRRPTMPLRRGVSRLTDATPVYRGEREIIASN